MIDLAAVRRAVDPQYKGKGSDVLCPLHEDRKPSLSIGIGERGDLVCRCHAGCDQRAVFDEVRRRAGHLMNGHACEVKAKVRKTVHEYASADGEVLLRVHRTDKPDGSKTFSQSTPDGKGGWSWRGIKGKTPLYRLPALAAAPRLPVVICEGEKAAEAAQRLLGDSMVATTWPGGAAAVDSADLSPLQGRDVVVWPDADAAGKSAAATLLARLSGIAAQVRVVRVDDLPAKADAADVNWSPLEFNQRLTAPEPDATPADTTYKLLTVPQLRATPALPQLIADLMPARGLAVLYGEPGSGKSFLALDVAAHLARRRWWAGRRTRRAKVVYVALEGHLRERIAAYQRHHDLTDADLEQLLVIQGQHLNLLEADAMRRLIVDIKAQLGEYAGHLLVVVDTLARAMPGGNENASEDMGRIVAACADLEQQLGALVILVHHAGKDASRGARGWSGLRGAADVEILIERDGDRRTATFAKVKDGTDGVAVEFRLEVVDLGPRAAIDPEAGEDERITSCVAVVTDANAKPQAADTGRMGKNMKLLLDAIRTSGPWPRAKAYAFMAQAGIHKSRTCEAIDALLVRGLVDDIVPVGLTARR